MTADNGTSVKLAYALDVVEAWKNLRCQIQRHGVRYVTWEQVNKIDAVVEAFESVVIYPAASISARTNFWSSSPAVAS